MRPKQHMSLNVAKCGVMQCSFSSTTLRPSPLHVTGHDQTVPIALIMTLLAVTLSPSLKWEQPVETVLGRAGGIWTLY